MKSVVSHIIVLINFIKFDKIILLSLISQPLNHIVEELDVILRIVDLQVDELPKQFEFIFSQKETLRNVDQALFDFLQDLFELIRIHLILLERLALLVEEVDPGTADCIVDFLLQFDCPLVIAVD